MKRIERVYVVPIWDGFDRALAPVEKHRPDVVYLLEDENTEMPAPYEQFKRDVAADAHDLQIGRLDLFDLYDVMGFVTTLADRHADDTVWVNISAGTIDSALGATMACMDSETDATPFRVFPENPTPGVSTGDVTLVEGDGLDIFPIRSPSRDQLIALALIEACNTESRKTKKKTLLAYGKEYGMACLQGTEGRGRYNKLSNHVTDDLETKGYIEYTDAGDYLTVTETGLQTLRAFRHRIEDVITRLESAEDELVRLDLDHPIETLETWAPEARRRETFR